MDLQVDRGELLLRGHPERYAADAVDAGVS
jgi:hypothetical protein